MALTIQHGSVRRMQGYSIPNKYSTALKPVDFVIFKGSQSGNDGARVTAIAGV